MDSAVLDALRGSIRKWQAIVDGIGSDGGASNCPLCQLFHPSVVGAHDPAKVTNETCCNGCPVKERTGEPLCRATPYEKYIEAITAAEMDDAAEAELAFLKTLLPIKGIDGERVSHLSDPNDRMARLEAGRPMSPGSRTVNEDGWGD